MHVNVKITLYLRQRNIVTPFNAIFTFAHINTEIFIFTDNIDVRITLLALIYVCALNVNAYNCVIKL